MGTHCSIPAWRIPWTGEPHTREHNDINDSDVTYLHRSGSDGKASAYNVVDLGSIPGAGRSPGEGNGNPPQYSCLENPEDRGAW